MFFCPFSKQSIQKAYLEAAFSEAANSKNRVKDFKALFEVLNSQLEELGLPPFSIHPAKASISPTMEVLE